MNDKVVKLLKDPVIFPSMVGLVSLGVGGVVGFLLGRRQREFVHAVPAEQDWSLADLRAVEDQDEDEESEEEVDVATAGEAFIRSRIADDIVVSADKEEAERVPEAIKQSIFNEGDDIWDREAEIAKRTTTEPYILHKDEYLIDERSYSQETLTYYVGDDILCDVEDKPLYNYAITVGPLLFGHGSGDQNTVYVRNDKLKAEYEILRDKGHYSVEVMGLELEEDARQADLQHSGNRKFRQD